MNPREKRAADRITELIKEGEAYARPRQSKDPFLRLDLKGYQSSNIHSWITRSQNVLQSVCGDPSVYAKRIEDAANTGHRLGIVAIIGILHGVLTDLEDGFLVGQERLIAGEIFDSVLEQAGHLVKRGYKDPAAVLARVVVEDSLRRICREHGLDDSGKASALNELLRKEGHHTKPQWRLISSWLDIGNSAAHGKFDEYTGEDVERMIRDVEGFLGNAF